MANSFLLLSADVLIDHCLHNPKLKNTRGLVRPHISREWHLLSDSITHKHTHLFTHCGLWENERNTCIFQLHRTFISYVRLTRSFEEEKERRKSMFFLDDSILQLVGWWGAVSQVGCGEGLAGWNLSSFFPHLGWEVVQVGEIGDSGGRVTAGRQQRRAPGCSGRWWQQTGLASQWEGPGQWRLARQRYLREEKSQRLNVSAELCVQSQDKHAQKAVVTTARLLTRAVTITVAMWCQLLSSAHYSHLCIFFIQIFFAGKL